MDGRDPGSTPGVGEETAVEPLICRHLGPVPLSTPQFNSVSRVNLAFGSTPLLEKFVSRQSAPLSRQSKRRRPRFCW
jgi:hypothetical protein